MGVCGPLFSAATIGRAVCEGGRGAAVGLLPDGATADDWTRADRLRWVSGRIQ